MKKSAIVALFAAIMIFACGCSSNDAQNMMDDAENMAEDMADGAENMVDNIEKSIFPSELEEEGSEYFRVTSSSTDNNMVTLKGTVMMKIDKDDGTVEYEYGKQDSEITFDADNAKIKYYDEENSKDTTETFSEYLKKYGDEIKDKIYKITIEDGIITEIAEADYQASINY
mgnify:CR=1 FL=1